MALRAKFPSLPKKNTAAVGLRRQPTYFFGHQRFKERKNNNIYY